MTGHCVVGVYRSMAEAQKGIEALEQSHIPQNQISFVTHSVARELPNTKILEPGDEAETDAAKGAGMGGLLGALAGAPLLLIPGVGPILFAGPLATGITGAIVGGFLGSMRGWGVHHDHVQDYENKVAQGHPLLVVNGTPDVVAEAKTLMLKTDAMEVHLHETDSADAQEIDDRPENITSSPAQ